MRNDSLLFIVDDAKYLFDGKSFSEAPTKVKEYYSASTIRQSDIKTYGFKVLSNFSAEKLAMQAELKMYDEGGLDPEVDHTIDFIKIAIEGVEESFIESYAVKNALLEEKFALTAKSLGALDYIYPEALSYEALYVSELLEKKNDLFIYFGEKESYAVIFKEGEYISTRSFESLEDIGQRVGGIDADTVRKVLATQGVQEDLYAPDEFLRMTDINEEISKIVEKITYAIRHKRGAFKLNGIDRIFLDFEGSDIPGFLELFNSYGYDQSSKELLNPFEAVDVGMKHNAINALYALNAIEEKAEILNLTIFERRPAFLKTHVGQFSMVLMSAVVLSSLYPIYATYTLNNLDAKESSLQTKVTKMERATKKLSKKLKAKRAKRDALLQKKKSVVEEIQSYGYMLQSLEDIKQSIKLREQMMQDINDAMKKYRLSSRDMEMQNSQSVTIQIITTNKHRDNIAKFIKELLLKGYARVQTQKVLKNRNYYESFVEISR